MEVWSISVLLMLKKLCAISENLHDSGRFLFCTSRNSKQKVTDMKLKQTRLQHTSAAAGTGNVCYK